MFQMHCTQPIMYNNGPLHQVERCSRSSYEDDDGRMQGGKNTAAHEPEFQIGALKVDDRAA
ncbi:hypothetical protein PILCRDRAFT_8702 [Piloderma croceum F 1598]|uniref:Uncharacterized protein n=1 Tax=Piloderma croceum (strain F 1598) TaxID=765440 RepID=A0A0C3FNK8_PILCF|nr:hypothetical protein PILCRDRAFT_8702 [Piloderma croceum F 1598]